MPSNLENLNYKTKHLKLEQQLVNRTVTITAITSPSNVWIVFDDYVSNFLLTNSIQFIHKIIKYIF